MSLKDDEYIEQLEATIIDLCHDCGVYDLRKISDVSDERLHEILEFVENVTNRYNERHNFIYKVG